VPSSVGTKRGDKAMPSSRVRPAVSSRKVLMRTPSYRVTTANVWGARPVKGGAVGRGQWVQVVKVARPDAGFQVSAALKQRGQRGRG